MCTRMRLETKFLRLKTPVAINSRVGEWRVSWVGGWTRHRMAFLVMLVRVTKRNPQQIAQRLRFSRSLMIVRIDTPSLFYSPT
jgi:hypothetical protein